MQKQQRNKRYQHGSVVLDSRTRVWWFRWREGTTRKAERIGKYRSKSEAMRAAEGLRLRINGQQPESSSVTVNEVAQRYILEQMPKRHSTRRGYKKQLAIICRDLGSKALPLNSYDAELWLKSLNSSTGEPYAPKTKSHIKNMLGILHRFAMHWGYIAVSINPISMFRVDGASRRQRAPIILSVDQFRRLLAEIKGESYRTMILLAICLGLRVSEICGLRWHDVDWKRCELKVERGAVEGHIDDVKTEESRKRLPLDEAVLSTLRGWKAQTQFQEDGDFIFASPVLLGTKPLRGNGIQQEVIRPAALRLGLGSVGWHSLRHSYRTWLEETGAPISVQRELMRHSTISMTMDGYGRGVASANRAANAKVVSMLFSASEVDGLKLDCNGS